MHEIHVLPDLCGEFSEVLFRFCISSIFYNVTKRVKDASAHNQKTVLRNCGMWANSGNHLIKWVLQLSGKQASNIINVGFLRQSSLSQRDCSTADNCKDSAIELVNLSGRGPCRLG